MKKVLALVLALALLLSCTAFADESAPEYTYESALTVFPTNWNIHRYETSTDSEIADWITEGFYGFDYKDREDPEAGYKMVPVVASSDPIDVTADYVGEEWGIAEGETGRAWKIEIRENLAWQDGTPITSKDFIESYKRLIYPNAANYRADGLWSGNMVIVNAKNYAYAGKVVDEDNGATGAYAIEDLVKGEDGTYTTPEGGAAFVGVNVALDWLSGNTLKTYVDNYGDAYFGMDHWAELEAAANEEGLAPLTDDTIAWLTDVVATNPSWGETDGSSIPAYVVYKTSFPEMDFEKVGMKADGDHAIVFILEKELSGFYLYYSLTSNYLVNIDLYDACASEEGGVYTNSYGTSAETTMSYGPYMLESFQNDKEYTFVKNPYWYGWDLPENEGLYQTTRMHVSYLPEKDTRLEAFLSGKLDSFGLDRDDMETYSSSDYCYYSEGDSIYAMVFNPDVDKLAANQAIAGENINKTILTVKEFRMAMSMAMNRAEFCLATSPTNGPAFALYGSQIIADPDNGIPYRATDAAKNTIVSFWGLADEIGEGKLYATVDDAIASISGYNLEMAKAYFDAAYDIAIQEGLMDDDDVVSIIIGTPNLTSPFYNNGYEYIVNNYTEAVKGTKLEGKLVFTRDGTIGNSYADALKNNNVDMLFGVGWTGSTFDPYNLMQVYVDPSYQYDSNWDAKSSMLTVELDGAAYTTSCYNWYQIIQSNAPAYTVKNAEGADVELQVAENEQRMFILAALENAILQNYNYLPLMNSSSASLKSMKVEFFTEEQVFPMGRGGVKFMTYNYDDAAWEAFVASQNGELNYK